MMRSLASCGVAAVVVATVVVLSAQSDRTTANNEPHHKRLLYTNDVRLLDVTVPAGETTADHVHEYDMATVVIGDGKARVTRNGEDISAPMTGSPGSIFITEQTGAPATYRVQNSGSTDYHILELENMREGGGWLTPPLMTAPGVTATKQSRAFTIYDGQLKADAPATHSHSWSTVLIVLSGTIENGGIGGEVPVRLQRLGQWLTFPRAINHSISAVGGDAHIIEIEAR
jgi:quercetin dioxygenase-like cupin family protein